MKRINWTRVMYFAGIAALIIGILDFLEGSVVIAAGSLLITIATYLTHDRHRKLFLLSTILIAIGVSLLFYLSSLGGFAVVHLYPGGTAYSYFLIRLGG